MRKSSAWAPRGRIALEASGEIAVEIDVTLRSARGRRRRSTARRYGPPSSCEPRWPHSYSRRTAWRSSRAGPWCGERTSTGFSAGSSRHERRSPSSMRRRWDSGMQRSAGQRRASRSRGARAVDANVWRSSERSSSRRARRCSPGSGRRCRTCGRARAACRALRYQGEPPTGRARGAPHARPRRGTPALGPHLARHRDPRRRPRSAQLRLAGRAARWPSSRCCSVRPSCSPSAARRRSCSSTTSSRSSTARRRTLAERIRGVGQSLVTATSASASDGPDQLSRSRPEWRGRPDGSDRRRRAARASAASARPGGMAEIVGAWPAVVGDSIA